jgi:branched-chain amino acid transport system substrate-binding protein
LKGEQSMTRNIFKVTLYTLLLAVFIFTVSCGQQKTVTPEADPTVEGLEKDAPAPDKEPYLIGAVFAVTGGAAWLGEPEKNTAEMVAEQINKAGGINGHPIKLIIEDTEGDNQKSLQAVRKLISQDVLAIIGPSRSGCTMAVVPTMNEEEVPLISCAAAAAIISPVADRKWIFKTPQRDDDCARRIFEHAKAKGYTDMAIITGTTGFGSEGRK